ncbi:MAG: hypothetical protein LUH15_08720 [Tannerellaceae bacterium]|nr:hypothetical protein [Tannerellaceae bacterium]
MKKRIISLLTYSVVFSMMATSCSDFLIQESRTAMTEEDVFAKIDNVEPLVVGLYNSFIEVKKAGKPDL